MGLTGNGCIICANCAATHNSQSETAGAGPKLGIGFELELGSWNRQPQMLVTLGEYLIFSIIDVLGVH